MKPTQNGSRAEQRAEPEVIVFQEPGERVQRSSKKEYQAFMSSTVPQAPPRERKVKETDEAEVEDSRNDLALRRLLKESHLLSEPHVSLKSRGKSRHEALQARIEALGGAKAKPQQHSWKIKSGIERKARDRATREAKEAKDAGILMARHSGVSKQKAKHRNGRDRGLNFTKEIGKFRKGNLALSKNVQESSKR